VSELHLVLGIAVLGSNALAGAWGAACWLRGEPSIAFWYLLRTAQAIVVLQVLVGGVLIAIGESAPDDLHVIYGLSPLLVSLVSEGMRVRAMQRELEPIDEPDSLERPEQVALARRIVLGEMGVMTIGAILIVTLSLRAMQSG